MDAIIIMHKVKFTMMLINCKLDGNALEPKLKTKCTELKRLQIDKLQIEF